MNDFRCFSFFLSILFSLHFFSSLQLMSSLYQCLILTNEVWFMVSIRSDYLIEDSSRLNDYTRQANQKHTPIIWRSAPGYCWLREVCVGWEVFPTVQMKTRCPIWSSHSSSAVLKWEQGEKENSFTVSSNVSHVSIEPSSISSALLNEESRLHMLITGDLSLFGNQAVLWHI